MPKIFDLPEPLLRRAETAAADAGLPLEDFVMLAVEAKTAAHEGSMPFRVERNDLISPWLARRDEPVDA